MTQEMRSHIWCDRLLASCCQGILEDGIDDLAVLERTMRCPVCDERCPATRLTTLLTKISAQDFADLGCYRQAVMELTLAADQQLTCTPVNVVELDRDDLGRAEAEPRHKQQHSIIARAMSGVAAHRAKNGLDPIGRQVPGQPRVPALCRLGKTQGKIARRRPAPEQILEEGPKMGRGWPVSIRILVCQQVLDEANGVGGPKTCQVDLTGSEAIIEEPVSKTQKRGRWCVGSGPAA